MKSTIYVSFSRPDTTVDPSTEATLSDISPISGVLKSILLHFPDGCNALVEIACILAQTQVLPDKGRIMLNDTTNEFLINRRLENKAKLCVIITNKDKSNSHTPSIIWAIEGEDDGKN